MAHVPRLYIPGRLGPGPLTLDADAAHRLSSVMRLRPGDPFLVFAGDGREWGATVSAVGRNQIEAVVGPVTRTGSPLPLVVECWCAAVRPARFDWAIEKSTEAGVDVVRPLYSEHSVRGEAPSATRQARWERIAVEAAEQSGRLSVPVIAPGGELEQLIAHASGSVLILDRGGRPWTACIDLLPEQGGVTVAVGPEGGFSEAELSASVARGALAASLGPNILRTETAAVAAVLLLRSLGR
ncbi:MAG: RsmE family RNA methyltransferase [Tepidiformaceae bacterium]